MWHRTGTVSVTADSDTVTGSGTAWAQHIRVGDGFQGPDGRLYEVTNVASDTVLSIAPAYQGATASGQVYWIIPVQGYTKRLADRAAELIGSQLDIDRLAGEAQESADDAEVSAAAAQAAVNVVADHADQASTSAQGAASSASAAADSADRAGQSEQASASSATASADSATAANESEDAAQSFANDSSSSADLAQQWAQNPEDVPVRPDEYSALHWAKKARDVVHGDSFLEKLQNLGDLEDAAVARANLGLGSAALRQAIGTAPLYGRDSVVGTVGMAGGVPTGAIVQRGSNPGGEFIRFADGTQICWAVSFEIEVSNAEQEVRTAWTLPASLSAPGAALISLRGPLITQAFSVSKLAAASFTSEVEIRFRASFAQSYRFGILCVGRWD